MKTIQELHTLLSGIHPSEIDRLFHEEADSFFAEEHAFSRYIRSVFRKNRITMRDLFRRADIPEHYGYKLLGQEVSTRQRDTLLRVFYSGGFTFEESNTALALYRMPSLYARIPRDAALITVFHAGWRDIDQINSFLTAHGFEGLRPCGEHGDPLG